MFMKTLNLVETKDGEQIAVWQVIDSVKDNNATNGNIAAASSVAKTQNILLTHGTFSDKHTCLKIAEYLASYGHHCYIMEWRGHGHSSVPKDKFNFETVATYDFEATFGYLFDELELDNLHCVTHSGGGVGLTMFLVQNPRYIDKINSITMFACQAFGAVVNVKNHLKILTAKLFTRLFGYIPAKKLKMGPINESYYTMNQWFDWNLQKNFNSSFIKQSNIEQSKLAKNIIVDVTNDGSFDYRQHMPMITIPIYAISARGDKFISPTGGCKLFFDAFNNPTNVFREYSISNGDLDDYTHSRIMISRNAAKEIWPTVVAWIEKYAK
ncbi:MULTISPECIES: alpha/beta fold hydrolase [unclassified Psychrobacter]|uniref:alpha/beta fold hydrolase n=1 Tax=unclassified Psychrobacter TaxID=196806 RepID=UPI00071E8401|nr:MULTISPECIES: alpha/beta hydrolase [unclassified Psychrobacter]OLF35673.1 alpha/beta hydrolase [Psychrobacter sp. Cmf 22.2]